MSSTLSANIQDHGRETGFSAPLGQKARFGPGHLSKLPVSPRAVETAAAGITRVAYHLPPWLHLALRGQLGAWA